MLYDVVIVNVVDGNDVCMIDIEDVVNDVYVCDVFMYVYSRVEKMLEQKKSLIDVRKKQSAHARLQKETIMKVMEELRTNATKASKIIAMGMSGSKISLDSLVSTGSKSRSRSKEKKSKSTSQLLGGGGGATSPDGSYFPGASSPQKEAFYSSSSEQIAPAPYVSPYLASEA